ncbi:MAG: 2-C-methyl-D-erythritol 4-phosphate cytidylyltransferase [Clostridium sp.]|nr:2-C-methyl-D-erythritol 4-phosphate cytidylyltransferase [Acetatifactor muris]MCM1528254.1 2-C-methyl-D-erythritol 4-phosphate cytidylyltransferase [Bacteroides sp.]MCM1563478.1 2-C-methyl-D-erythritol 4-phosphate cytidylyltransferase [Clostridium sp.]
MNIALILSGGTGSRLGSDIPKQYLEVGGRPVIAYCLQTMEDHPLIDVVWIVAHPEWRDFIKSWAGVKLRGFSDPGENRQLSILNGLTDIRGYAPDDAVVLIHDAARPLVSARTVTECVEGCAEHEGVMPALPMKDTVYCGVDGRIESLLERKKVIAGQAPEAFRLERYFQANRMLTRDGILAVNGSTEPAIMAGMDVCYIEGDERNFKVTTIEDLERFRRMVEDGQ